MFISVLPFNFQCVFPLPVLYTKPFIQLLLDHHTHYKFHPIHRDTCRIGHKLVGHTGRKNRKYSELFWHFQDVLNSNATKFYTFFPGFLEHCEGFKGLQHHHPIL